MANSELGLQIKVVYAIKELYGENVWIFKANDNNRVGIPDIILCFFGHLVAIELKSPQLKKGEGLRPMQVYNINQINIAQGSAFDGNNLFEILEKLDEIYHCLHLFDSHKERGRLCQKKPLKKNLSDNSSSETAK